MVNVGVRESLLLHSAAVFGLGAIEKQILERLLERAIAPEMLPPVRLRELVADTLGHDRRAHAAVDPHGPLFRFALVSVRGSGAWLDRRVALADDFWPRLVEHWPLGAPRAKAPERGLLARLVLPPAIREHAARSAMLPTGEPRAFVVAGARGSGRHALARAIAGERARAVLELAGAALAPSDVPIVLRELRWQDAIALVERADLAAPHVLTVLLSGIADGGGDAVLTASSGWIPPARPERWAPPVRVARIELPPHDASSRAALWHQLLLEERAPAGVPVESIAASYRFGAERIHALARELGARSEPPDERELAELCRGATAIGFDGLARRIDLVHEPADLIVPGPLRRELELVVTWGRRAAALFGAGGAGRRAHASHGLSCLFHGPPGTGKTMAAQVLARQLGIALFRVDLSQLVDKYVGETEKRLDRLFAEADAAGCALLFDEADAIFARRGELRDARDRYANLETSFLLQRIEDHHGLCFLTSNLQKGIDRAFFRRLGLVVEFPLPGRAERRALWDALLPPAAERTPDVAIDYLAERFVLTGGDIRNAVIAALLIADAAGAPLAMEHLVIASWRELQKAGRLVDPRDLGPWHEAIARQAPAERSA